jgi:hypothetical protein
VHTKNVQGWELRSLAALGQYPHMASVELVHPDSEVRGRRWHSEIGLLQKSAGADVELTVLVHTSEISAKVTAEVTPAAPAFVRELLVRCKLSSAAIGGEVRRLADEDGEAFRHVILDPARQHPFVVVSPTPDGTYAIDIAHLSELLVGVAELVVIPPEADTYWLARGVGEEFVPYRGAVKIVHPVRGTDRTDVRTFTADELSSLSRSPRKAAQELFSWVLHRTNLPISWKHVSPARVREEQLRRELELRRAQAASSGDAAAYIKFLEEYGAERDTLLRKVTDDRVEAEQRYADLVSEHEQSKRAAEAKVEALQFQLVQAAAGQDESPYRPEDIDRVAEAIASAIAGSPTPAECLIILEHLFPSRITVLPEAWTSARESASFKHGQKLFRLLHSLATEYWEALARGTPDQEARKVLGAAYAPKESEGVANNREAKRRRTFSYDGTDHLMQRHLKIGVKDSAAETIRVHFEWFAERSRIVIGHCGPHLAFS